MKSTLLRFLRWLRDSLPLHSTRWLAKDWLAGYELGQKAVGITRDSRGRFKRL